VAFAGSTGMFQIDLATFGGSVTGFSGQDGIDIRSLAFSGNTTPAYTPNGSNTGGTLTVTEGANSINIALIGSYMASSFVAQSDNHGGTLVTDPPAGQQPQLTPPH
jgi:hypothetical protein